MGKILALLLTLHIFIIMIFQPDLNNLENNRDIWIQSMLQRETEKAAIDGYYTPTIKNEIYTYLQNIGYKQSDVQLNLTSTPVPRGSYITGTIKVPSPYSDILIRLLIGDKTTTNHVASATIMSEYLP